MKKTIKKNLAMALVICMLFSMFSGLAAASSVSSFQDISRSHWAYSYVNDVVTRNLFAGISDNAFGPEVSMNRAMFVTVISRLAGAQVDNQSATAFTDVPMGEWYSGAVAWGASNNIVSGTTETTFAPETAITREQMASLIVRYADYADIELEEIKSGSTFTDESAISAYALDAVKKCQRAGIINGFEDGSFGPQQTATRAQVAVIISLLVSGVPEEQKEDDRDTYTVTFNSNGGTSVESQKVKEGDTATRPTNPTRTGYNFGGWYEESALTNSYNFSTPVTKDITLYAKWNTPTASGGTGGGKRPGGNGGDEDTYSFALSANVEYAEGKADIKVNMDVQHLEAADTAKLVLSTEGSADKEATVAVAQGSSKPSYTFADLPDGTYTVTGSLSGKTDTATVKIDIKGAAKEALENAVEDFNNLADKVVDEEGNISYEGIDEKDYVVDLIESIRDLYKAKEDAEAAELSGEEVKEILSDDLLNLLEKIRSDEKTKAAVEAAADDAYKEIEKAVENKEIDELLKEENLAAALKDLQEKQERADRNVNAHNFVNDGANAYEPEPTAQEAYDKLTDLVDVAEAVVEVQDNIPEGGLSFTIDAGATGEDKIEAIKAKVKTWLGEDAVVEVEVAAGDDEDTYVITIKGVNGKVNFSIDVKVKFEEEEPGVPENLLEAATKTVEAVEELLKDILGTDQELIKINLEEGVCGVTLDLDQLLSLLTAQSADALNDDDGVADPWSSFAAALKEALDGVELQVNGRTVYDGEESVKNTALKLALFETAEDFFGKIAKLEEKDGVYGSVGLTLIDSDEAEYEIRMDIRLAGEDLNKVAEISQKLSEYVLMNFYGEADNSSEAEAYRTVSGERDVFVITVEMPKKLMLTIDGKLDAVDTDRIIVLLDKIYGAGNYGDKLPEGGIAGLTKKGLFELLSVDACFELLGGFSIEEILGSYENDINAVMGILNENADLLTAILQELDVRVKGGDLLISEINPTDDADDDEWQKFVKGIELGQSVAVSFVGDYYNGDTNSYLVPVSIQVPGFGLETIVLEFVINFDDTEKPWSEEIDPEE